MTNKSRATTRTIYIIRWRAEPYFKHQDGPRGYQQGRSRLLKSFVDRDRAKEYLSAVSHGDIVLPCELNPFFSFKEQGEYPDDDDYKGLAGLTTFDEPIFEDWIRDLGLEPPAAKEINPYGEPIFFADWFAWWEEQSPTMTDYQRAKIWQALDKLDFFEIVETTLEE